MMEQKKVFRPSSSMLVYQHASNLVHLHLDQSRDAVGQGIGNGDGILLALYHAITELDDVLLKMEEPRRLDLGTFMVEMDKQIVVDALHVSLLDEIDDVAQSQPPIVKGDVRRRIPNLVRRLREGDRGLPIVSRLD